MAVKKTTSTSRAAAKIANAIKAEPAKAAKTAAKAVKEEEKTAVKAEEKVEEPVTRMVIIEPGTAQTFFEVVSDSLPPFVVQGYRDPCIRNVFNTQAYSDELTTKTTLLRGRVLVSVNNLSLKRVLEPVLQASWSTGTDEIIVKKVNMDIQFDK